MRKGEFAADETGQGLIEYALITSSVGLGAASSRKWPSTKIGNSFESIGTT